MNTEVLELRILKVYIPESVVVTTVVPSSVVAAAVVPSKVVPFNKIRSFGVRVSIINDTNKTQALELCIIIVYKPEAVVWAAYVPSSVVAAAVVPPTVVPCCNNRSNNNNLNCNANIIITIIHSVELRIVKVYIPEAVV